MSDPVYKILEVTGCSSTTLEDAVSNAISRAAKNAGQMYWFEVVETRGRINADKVAQWQVTLKIGAGMEG